MTVAVTDSREVRDLVAWAAGRKCLLCREAALLHRPTLIEGKRGSRYALIRAVPRVHEFDPGERRRLPRI